MTDLKYVTYCGLYCRLCATLARIPRQSAALRDTLQKDGWNQFGEYAVPGFKTFWAVLGEFSRFDSTCQGCRGGCGDPNCAIRQCAQGRKVDLCTACAQYPCARLENIARLYPNLLADGARQKQIGLDKWVEEQELRCRTAFCYADIRNPSS